MRLMGWNDRSMVDRYAADMQDQRAFEAKRRPRRHVLNSLSAGSRSRGPSSVSVIRMYPTLSTATCRA
jgi:hypothetical protein